MRQKITVETAYVYAEYVSDAKLKKLTSSRVFVCLNLSIYLSIYLSISIYIYISFPPVTFPIIWLYSFFYVGSEEDLLNVWGEFLIHINALNRMETINNPNVNKYYFFLEIIHTHTHTHTHTHIYIYIYIYVCVCVCYIICDVQSVSEKTI